ncbi:hypothetical protein CMI47_02920 [Candidatus Pacearchaeota archaeon]|nr:hypothetical protein [Candidatus Pacearchaeota archaeon]|tara:strand:+ start:1105 stop:2805 length:1701 start_codon:yes stop_codon:yes gene_type:complete
MYDAFLDRDLDGDGIPDLYGQGGGDPAAAAGAVVQGAAMVINAITGAVTASKEMENRPDVYTRKKMEDYNKELRRVRNLNNARSRKLQAVKDHEKKRAFYKKDSQDLKKETEKKQRNNRHKVSPKIKRYEDEIKRIKRDSQTLKKDLQKKLDKKAKFPNGAFIDGIGAQILKDRIKSITNNGVMTSKDARYAWLKAEVRRLKKKTGKVKNQIKENEYKAILGSIEKNGVRRKWDADYIHRGHRIDVIKGEIERNENHRQRQDLKKAWGYLTNIFGFAPFLKKDTSGMGMRVLQNIPAQDDLIGKNALKTVFPWGDGSTDAKAGQVPIWQRSATLQSWLNYFGDGLIPGNTFPPMWVYGLKEAEARELDPGAPVGALYDVAMVNFPEWYQPKYHTGGAIAYTDPAAPAEEAVSGYGGWGEQGVSFLDMTWDWDETHGLETGYDAFEGDAFGGPAMGRFMTKIVAAIRDGSANKLFADKQASPQAPPPDSGKVLADAPPGDKQAIKDATALATTQAWPGRTDLVPSSDPVATMNKEPEKLGMSTGVKVGIGIGAVALLGGVAWFATRD